MKSARPGASSRPLPFSPTSSLSLERTVSLLKVAGERTRMRVLRLLEGGDLPVSDFVTVLN